MEQHRNGKKRTISRSRPPYSKRCAYQNAVSKTNILRTKCFQKTTLQGQFCWLIRVQYMNQREFDRPTVEVGFRWDNAANK
jgi:hypothetical protein